MTSLFLSQLGLLHVMTGCSYNFRLKDNPQVLSRDFTEVLKKNNLYPSAVYTTHQIHGDDIVIVDERTTGTKDVYSTMLGKADGLITSEAGVALVIKVADCVPLLIFDPLNRVQANLHSGWRGTLQKIGPKAVELMKSNYGSEPKNLYAYLGPSISQNSFQVRDDVVNEWIKTFPFAEEVIRREDEEFSYIDIKTTILNSLLEVGMMRDRISISQIDTFTSPNYHSYRREGKGCGLNLMISMISK